MGTSRTAILLALQDKKKKLSNTSSMNGVDVWSRNTVIKGGTFPKNLMQDVGEYVESYANASGDGTIKCTALHPFNRTAREDCFKRVNQSGNQDFELERIRAENERLAIEASAKSVTGGMSTGGIALITIGSIAALTGMVILIKKYAK